MRAEPVPACASAIEQAARLLNAGELVAFPTETVYGLGADATNDRAVAAIFAAKGRPHFNPLIVHVPGLAEAGSLAKFDAQARRIAAHFWPGPLTLVLPRRSDSGLSLLASAGLDTVAIRALQIRRLKRCVGCNLTVLVNLAVKVRSIWRSGSPAQKVTYAIA